MHRFVTVEMALVLALAAGVGLVLLNGVAVAALRGARTRLRALHQLASDGLMGQARAHIPQPLAGSPFETLVHALDRGDGNKAQGAYQRLLRQIGRPHLTGWLALALAAPPLAALPLIPAALAALATTLGAGGDLNGCWQGIGAAVVGAACLWPLALSAATLGLHIHTLERGRRASAAAALLQHAGKELR